MTIDEVIKYFGNNYRYHKRTGMSPNNIYNWKRLGYIPIDTQMKIEQLSNGELKADLSDAK